MEKGEWEAAYWSEPFLDPPTPPSAGPFPRERLLRHTAELAYGITDRWWVEAYADFEQPTQGAREQLTFDPPADRKSTRLNSSHVRISYAVFCLKKKKKTMSPHSQFSPSTIEADD